MKVTDILVKVVMVSGETLFLYGLLAWAYGIIFFFIEPKSLYWPLSHLTPNLRQDVFTIASFIVSMVGFFIWRLFKGKAKREEQGKKVRRRATK